LIWLICLEGFPARPYIIWGGQGYMEILTKYELKSPT
jgi:hypothetical protein